MSKTNERNIYLMSSISQIDNFLNQLTQLSKNIFDITSNLEPLSLVDKVTPTLLAKINDPIFQEKLTSAVSLSSELITLTKPISENIQKILSKQKFYKSKNPMQAYADFKIDEAPVIKNITSKLPTEKHSFEELLKSFEKTNGKPLKPISKSSSSVPPCNCPHCGATKEYIYDNNKRGQWLCKICRGTFSIKTNKSRDINIFCPHCDHQLEIKHDRNNYITYACNNPNCSFYLSNKRKVAEGRGKDLLVSSGHYKLHYYYRAFKFSIDEIKNNDIKFDTKVQLKNIHCSDTILGLVLTYHVNYGLSTRKTANILWDVHHVKISHQTIANYSEVVAANVQGIVDKYPYDLSNEIAADETYVEVRGKNKYVFFISDVKKKTILSYRIFNNRDTLNATKSIYMAISKYSSIPDDLHIITDANPIYNASQLYFKLNGINFDLYQVIGVSNKDEVSKKWRYCKQIEERLNRTFKQNYYGMNGFDNINSANVYMVLYAAFFNFLRKHSSLNYNPPVKLKELDDNDLMANKWLKLIQLSQQYI